MRKTDAQNKSSAKNCKKYIIFVYLQVEGPEPQIEGPVRRMDRVHGQGATAGPRACASAR